MKELKKVLNFQVAALLLKVKFHDLAGNNINQKYVHFNALSLMESLL